jgi:hypothetical protein
MPPGIVSAARRKKVLSNPGKRIGLPHFTVIKYYQSFDGRGILMNEFYDASLPQDIHAPRINKLTFSRDPAIFPC